MTRVIESLAARQAAPPSSLSDEGVHSKGYVGYVIALLAIVNVVNYVDRMALAVMAPSIKAELQLSDGQLGLLTGFAFAIFYAICGIPIARWADRGVRRNITALALATWSVMTGLSGAAQNFWHLFLARVGVGAGEAGGLSPAQSMICDYVPAKRRSGAFALHTMGIYVGIMLGMVVAGWLAEEIGWRLAFVVLGTPGILLALVVRFTLREPVRGYFDVAERARSELSLRETVRILWRCRSYRLILLVFVVNGFGQYGLNQWWPSFYARVFDLSPSAVGVPLGIAIGVGSVIGLLIGGVLANRLVERDVRLPIKLGAGATALAIPAALASLFAPSASLSICFVSITALLWTVCNGPLIAMANSVVTSRMRATAGALNTFATSLLGFGLGPVCVGVLSDVLAPDMGRESLRYALLAPVALMPVMVFILFAVGRTLLNDLRAVGARL